MRIDCGSILESRKFVLAGGTTLVATTPPPGEVRSNNRVRLAGINHLSRVMLICTMPRYRLTRFFVAQLATGPRSVRSRETPKPRASTFPTSDLRPVTLSRAAVFRITAAPTTYA
ncbi:MAG: hypothetical protein MI923_25805 [Phycisphaerales bacterium]|nr:hypothetical protein [Phycisphaerales bacterium]